MEEIWDSSVAIDAQLLVSSPLNDTRRHQGPVYKHSVVHSALPEAN